MKQSTTKIQNAFEVAANRRSESARRDKKRVACALAIFAILALQTTAPGKLAGNKLAGNKLSPYSAAANSAAASTLAASPIAAGQLGPNRYAANSEATRDFMATSEGREVLSFIVSCALPACEHFSPQGYYRDCHDQPGDESRSDAFRQVITVFVMP